MTSSDKENRDLHTVDDVKKILQQYWKYSDFRGKQTSIINSILNKEDTLALMPTGGGKSICFQVPGLVFGGLTLVVSPLIALMNDQIEQLNKRGIKAVAITSALTTKDIDRLLDNCIYGDIKFLYVSPERLTNELFLARLPKMPIKLIAIDEAHCISQWGYDFRPAYLNINTIRPILKDVPIIALTASATPEVQQDICTQLEFDKFNNIIKQSFSRENLIYVAFESNTKEKRLLEILEKVKGSAVIYVRNRKLTKDITGFLNKRNISADFYHAGLSAEDRQLKQSNWINDKTRVIIATNAFGMGIDKPDVRLVVHLDVPENPEAYFQEAGRAGRDGNKAYAVLLWNKQDIEKLNGIISDKYPDKKTLNSFYQKLGSYTKTAYNSLPEKPININLKELAEKTELTVTQTLKRLKTLEWCGWTSINMQGKVVSTVEWKSSVRNAQDVAENSSVLSFLIRGYANFFEQEVSINETKISKSLQISRIKVVEELKQLQNQNWLIYTPASTNIQLSYLQHRATPERFSVPAFLYNTLKKQDEKRVETLLNYLQRPKCRSVLLLEYFGETNIENCGKCDVCTHYGEIQNVKDIEQQIFSKLEVKHNSEFELIQSFKPGKHETVKQVLRNLLDNKKITKQTNGLLTLTN